MNSPRSFAPHLPGNGFLQKLCPLPLLWHQQPAYKESSEVLPHGSCNRFSQHGYQFRHEYQPLSARYNLFCIIHIFIRNRKHLHLYRSKPCWECTCKMLDQNTDKTLDGSKSNTVDHDRTMFLAVSTNIFTIKTERKLEIKLDSTTLPGSSDGVLKMEVNLRSVERSVSLIYYIIKPRSSRAPRRASVAISQSSSLPMDLPDVWKSST